MAGSLNKVQIIGHVGNFEIRTMQNGGRVANLSVATNERYKDKNGERQEKTDWHKIVIFNDGLVTVCENYLSKGSKVYLEGQLETHKFTDQQGNERYMTEVVLRPYKSELILLGGGQQSIQQNATQEDVRPGPADELEDEIPF